jgi:hypothetical protein
VTTGLRLCTDATAAVNEYFAQIALLIMRWLQDPQRFLDLCRFYEGVLTK